MRLNLIRACELSGEPSSNASVATEASPAYGSRGRLARLQLGPVYEKNVGLVRDFIVPTDDRRSRRGNGTLIYEYLKGGHYEATSVWRSYKIQTVYFHVAGANDPDTGTITLLTEAQLYLMLSAAAGRDLAAEKAAALKARQEAELRALADCPDKLPELSGTAKQVAWGKLLRAQAILAARGIVQSNPRATEDIIKAASAQTHARWWIERRHDQPGALRALALAEGF